MCPLSIPNPSLPIPTHSHYLPLYSPQRSLSDNGKQQIETEFKQVVIIFPSATSHIKLWQHRQKVEA